MMLIGVYKVLVQERMKIPKEIMDRWSLKTGDKVVVYFDEESDRMVVERWKK